MGRFSCALSAWVGLFCLLACSSSSAGGAPGAAAGSSETGVSGSAGQSGSSAVGGAGNGASGASVGGNSAGVWRPFNDQSPWNTPIAANASVDSNSAAMIQDFSMIAGQTEFWINIQDYSVPVYFVDSTTVPMVTVAASLGGTGFRTGAATGDAAGTGMAPIPSGAMPAAGTDMHLAIVDKSAQMEWGFWDAVQGGSWTAGEASTLDLSGDGVRPPERNDPWWAGHGPRACGFGLIAGLITMEEMQAGAIEHALVVAYSHIMSRYYTSPASSAQGTTSDALPTRGIPCGGRIQLDPSLNLATLGLSPSGLAIATALQKYGAFVGDYSGATSLYADASSSAQAYWQGGALDNNSAQKIPLASFRVLSLGMTYDNMN